MRCGAPGDVDQKGDPILNPFGECKRRQGIAAYSFGATRPELAPRILGQLQLVWALHAEGIRLHTGGEFKRVSGVVQNSRAALACFPVGGALPQKEACVVQRGEAEEFHALWGGV